MDITSIFGLSMSVCDFDILHIVPFLVHSCSYVFLNSSSSSVECMQNAMPSGLMICIAVAEKRGVSLCSKSALVKSSHLTVSPGNLWLR